MGFGSTAKKLQKVADIADDLYSKVNELKSQLQAMRETVEETNDRVDDLDGRMDEQRALLEAIAEQQGIDTEAVVETIDADTADQSDGAD